MHEIPKDTQVYIYKFDLTALQSENMHNNWF